MTRDQLVKILIESGQTKIHAIKIASAVYEVVAQEQNTRSIDLEIPIVKKSLDDPPQGEKMNLPKYWNYRSASKNTDIPIGTYYAWVSTGRVPHIRLGKRHVLFPVEELLTWLEAHRVVFNNQEIRPSETS